MKKKILYIDANNLYSWVRSEFLPYDEIKFDKKVQLENILNTDDNIDTGCFVENDLNCPDETKQKSIIFSILSME